jgi:hypothetical protein
VAAPPRSSRPSIRSNSILPVHRDTHQRAVKPSVSWHPYAGYPAWLLGGYRFPSRAARVRRRLAIRRAPWLLYDEGRTGVPFNCRHGYAPPSTNASCAPWATGVVPFSANVQEMPAPLSCACVHVQRPGKAVWVAMSVQILP